MVNSMRRNVRKLFDIRNQYNALLADQKLDLLHLLADDRLTTANDVQQFHSALCFIRAFPDTPEHYRLAHCELKNFGRRVILLPISELTRLTDTGIAGSSVYYCFSFEVAKWLKRRAPRSVSIDWDNGHDPPGLDEVLTHLLLPAEDEYFDSGTVSAKKWIELASMGNGGTDFEWLLEQLGGRPCAIFWTELYNAAELWLKWDLQESRLAKSTNIIPTRTIHARIGGMRKCTGSAKTEIMRPLDSISRLNPQAGSKAIDVAMAALAVRHRETAHFNHANPHEVYQIDVGEGISIMIFGLLKEFRYPLECTMGFLIVSNGTPIGYGGSSVLFRQVNTGINIFDEFRGSETAFLWIQTMRAFHQITGCTRFIANAFQFGADNDEALKSGAFWFYYRLGYRPILTDVCQLAKQEMVRIRRKKGSRSNLQTLRQLASCDMHLALPGASQSDLFDEQWIKTSSMLATRVLGLAGGKSRQSSAKLVAARVSRDLGIRGMDRWPLSERIAFERIAPFVSVCNPAQFPTSAKRDLRKLLKAKGGAHEANYARLLGQNANFLSSLRQACIQAARN